MEATILGVDNKSAIAIAKKLVEHGRAKYIKVKYHVISEAEKSYWSIAALKIN